MEKIVEGFGMLKIVSVVALAAIFVAPGCAETPSAGPNKNVIGYPTVNAALQDLLKRPNVLKSVYQGWLILEDRPNKTMWSFAPKKHPAHPTAVRRRVVTEDGKIHIKTKILNDKARDFTQQRARLENSPTKPADARTAKATLKLQEFLKAIDEDRLRDAYGLFTKSFKKFLPYSRYEKLQRGLEKIGGGKPERSSTRITWYDNPTTAHHPGVFAAFNIECRVPKQIYCEEVIILHQDKISGDFWVTRHERNFIHPETTRRMRKQGR